MDRDPSADQLSLPRAALRFQPIRRPQPKQANKPKPVGSKIIHPTAATAATAAPTPTTAPSTATAPPKTTLAAWAAADDDDWRYGAADKAEKRQRGGRKKKKKKTDHTQLETDWDELYDPSKPTNVEEYLRSDERIAEVREWKDLLYRHRRKKGSSVDSDDEGEKRPVGHSEHPQVLRVR